MGLLAAAGADPAVNEDGELPDLTKSSFVPAPFEDTLQLVLEVCAHAAPAVRPGMGEESAELRGFLARVLPTFKTGAILIPFGKAIGAALRKQWSARNVSQAWKNYLALLAEVEIGPEYLEIPAKV